MTIWLNGWALIKITWSENIILNFVIKNNLLRNIMKRRKKKNANWDKSRLNACYNVLKGAWVKHPPEKNPSQISKFNRIKNKLNFKRNFKNSQTDQIDSREPFQFLINLKKNVKGFLKKIRQILNEIIGEFR